LRFIALARGDGPSQVKGRRAICPPAPRDGKPAKSSPSPVTESTP